MGQVRGGERWHVRAVKIWKGANIPYEIKKINPGVKVACPGCGPISGGGAKMEGLGGELVIGGQLQKRAETTTVYVT